MDILNYKNLQRTVLTNRGIIPEEEVTIGDKLFEYLTGNELEVTGVDIIPFERMFIVKYSDNREDLITDQDLIYGGNYLYHWYDLYNGTALSGIILTNITLFRPRLDPLKVDPYIAGSLIGFGDLESEYVSILSDKLTDELKAMIDLVPVDSGTGFIYFKRFKSDEEYITWDDYFGFTVYPEMIIPLEYAYGSIETRRRFLQGVFDAGYVMEHSPDIASINHWNQHLLEQIRWMINSLGLLANIVEEHQCKDVYKYRLQILGDAADMMKFFYSADYLDHILSVENHIVELNLKIALRIRGIADVKPELYTSGSYVQRFHIKNTKQALYMSGDFIPKVSL